MDGPQPYSEYKDSRLLWLGRIPAHWEEKRGKYYFREVEERSTTGDEPLLSVSHVTGVTRRKASVNMFMAESNVGYKVCRSGDLVINTMWAWMAAMGVSRQVGLVSPSYGVYRPRKGGLYSPEYLDHLLRSPPYASEYMCRSSGIRASRLRLYPDDFLDIPVVRPPLGEQEALARYITRQDHMVHRFVRNRRRLIDLLNEQKQAIITRTVTRGLNSDVTLKPSGIDWLGGIPRHWKVKPLKRWAAINRLVLPETTDPDYVFDYLDIGCVGTGILVDRPTRTRFGEAPSRARRIVRCGDTIISTVRTYLRAVYFVAEEANDLVASTGFAVLTPSAGVVPEFLGITLQSDPFVNCMTANSTGVGYPAITETQLGTFHVAMPPSLDEQQDIVKEVHKKTAALTTWIQRIQHQIKLIREYHVRLVADVVTGKIDVRGLAPAEPSDAGEGVDRDTDDKGIPWEDDPELVEGATDADE